MFEHIGSLQPWGKLCDCAETVTTVFKRDFRWTVPAMYQWAHMCVSVRIGMRPLRLYTYREVELNKRVSGANRLW